MANFWDDAPAVSPLDAALQLENVPAPLAALARSIYQQESDGGTNTTTSNAGAVGGMQILPSTFKSVADAGWNIDNPVDNARGGIRYLGQMLNAAGGDPRLAAAGYYGGPNGLAKARAGVAVSDPRNSNAPTTLQYADQVAGRLGNMADAAAAALLPAAQADELPKNWWEAAPVVSQDAPTGSGSDWWNDAPLAQPDAPSYSDGKGDSVTLHYDQPAAASPQAPAQPPASLGERLGRQVGLTGRAALAGLTGIPNMLWNGPANAINALAGTHIPLADANATADWLGLPQPQNSTERVAQDVASAMAPAGAFGLLGKIGDAATPITKSVTGLLSSNPLAQVGSAALGNGSAGTAREMGAPAGVQLGVGLLTGAIPGAVDAATVGSIRRLLIGDEAGRQRILENMNAFRAAGTVPTIGQATEGRFPRAVESLLSRTPGGAGIMAKKAANQADEISGRVDQLVGRLSNNAGPVEAGESVINGLQNFKAGVKGLQNQLYGTLDKYLPPQTPVQVDRTKAALAALNSDIEGAPALSAMFKNGRIQGIEHALGSDLSATTSYGAGPARRVSTLPYESIKKLRTLVGNEIDNANFTSDVPRDKWRALYAALSDDLGDAATAAGPQAAQAWNWANQFTKSQMARLEQLAGVIGKDAPEKVFQAALSGTAEGDTILRRVVSAIPKENRRDLAAAVVARMGRATPGNQNDLGEVFSPNTFLTNWNKLSPAAKETLFGRAGVKDLPDDLADIAKVGSNIREGSRVFANPSGTSAGLAQLGAAGLAGSAGTSLFMGHPLLAAGALMPLAAANAGARLMTNPNVVRWLADTPKPLAPYLGGGLLGILPGASQGLLDTRQ